MTSLSLNPQQLEFFRTFGFLHLPGLVADRIEQISGDFETVFAARGGGHNGKPHEGKARSVIVPFIDNHDDLCSLLDDPRVHGVATSLLGDDFNYMSSDGNYYVGDSGWHSDGWRPESYQLHVKFAFYLDPLTRDTGALRVIPGSHRYGDKFADSLGTDHAEGIAKLGVPGRDIPAFALQTKPGDLAVFNFNTKHSSWGGGSWRRMFTINLAQRYPEGRISDLKSYIGHFANYWADRVYGERMISTAGPQRMRHLEQVMANDGHLAELTRQAREKMKEPARG